MLNDFIAVLFGFDEPEARKRPDCPFLFWYEEPRPDFEDDK